MSNAREIIVRPLVTEKTMKIGDDNNTVVFEVKKGVQNSYKTSNRRNI